MLASLGLKALVLEAGTIHESESRAGALFLDDSPTPHPGRQS